MIFNNVAIVSGKRTAVGCIGGAFKHIPSPLLLSQIIKPALEKTPFSLITNSVFGCSSQYNLGINPAKQALELSGLESIPSYIINNGHIGGLKSVVLAAQHLEHNQSVALCGGFDSASLTPHTLHGRDG